MSISYMYMLSNEILRLLSEIELILPLVVNSEITIFIFTVSRLKFWVKM